MLGESNGRPKAANTYSSLLGTQSIGVRAEG
jgi:hypothetical protein